MAQRGRITPVSFEGVARPEWGPDGGRAPAIRTLTLDISVARDKEEIEIGGNFLWVSDATDNAANVNLAFTREAADQGILFKNGTRLSGLEFSRVFVTNSAQAGKTMTFVYAVEGVVTGLQIDNPAGDFSSVSLVRPTTIALPADISVAINTTDSTIAANANRSRLWIEADINNADNLRVGPTGLVTDTRGLLLTPGAAVEIFQTGAFDVRNILGASAAATYRYMDESD